MVCLLGLLISFFNLVVRIHLLKKAIDKEQVAAALYLLDITQRQL